jgi:putative ABC transport system permease protein
MSLWSRIVNVFRGDRVSEEIREEFQGHLEEAGREFGSAWRAMEESRDTKVIAWLDSLRADAVFGWRQIRKRKIASAVAILSLGLAIGSCTAAFRLIDALLLRPLPVAHPEQLYGVYREATDTDGTVRRTEMWAYPAFLLMRTAVKNQAELIAVSQTLPADLTYRGDQDIERANTQYVSGWMFGNFGLKPAAGRLLSEEDDSQPGKHAYGVISYDYWTRRFGRDPRVVGRTFRMSERIFEIVGVAPQGFTGTQTGSFTDVFVPMTMHSCAIRDDCAFHRTLARIQPGVEPELMREKMDATSRAFERERAKGFQGVPQGALAKMMLVPKVTLTPAAAGASGLQDNYRIALLALGVLVVLVLLIACANVANLMAAQAAARSREMALRVSIGAGRWRLVQLVMVESALLAILASAAGACFAWWSAPFVVGMINPPENPVRLVLPADGRVLLFGLLLTATVMFLFGLIPSLRASAVRPASALKGGSDARARRGPMHLLIVAQVAFCFLVLFVAGLFARTFEQLAHKPLGFSAERLLAVETVTGHGEAPVYWDQIADHLRAVPGVESVAIAGWPLLAGGSWNGFVSVNGAPPPQEWGYFLAVSPGWLETMKLRLTAGRDLRTNESTPGAALVNETFVKVFFQGRSPLGQSIDKGGLKFTVVGVVADAPYREVREEMLPVAFVPVHAMKANGELQALRTATFMVRTRNPRPYELAATIRRELAIARPGFRASNIRSQADLVAAQTVREQMVAILALFFAGVALALAAIGLYGVLDYSVLQRRREIGIRIAIGAKAGDIARRVTSEVFGVVAAGTLVGVVLGLFTVRYIEALLYRVKPGEPVMLVLPVIVIATVGLLASTPAVVRAVRIDPVKTLRGD